MGPAAVWTQHVYQAELQHPGAITQRSPPWARVLPFSGASEDGPGLQSHPPYAGWPTPHCSSSLGLILAGPGAENTRLLFGFFPHWSIGEMEKLLWGEDGQKLCLEGKVGTA